MSDRTFNLLLVLAVAAAGAAFICDTFALLEAHHALDAAQRAFDARVELIRMHELTQGIRPS